MNPRNSKFAQRLIDHAARRLPETLSERLQEEWQADLAARPSELSRLRFAIGCCWATQVIAYEHQPSRVAVQSAAVGKGILAYADHNSGFIARRSNTFLLVVSLHAVLFYLLMSTLSDTHKIVTEGPLQNRELPHVVPPQPPTLLPPLHFDGVIIEAPSPKTNLHFELDPNVPPEVTGEPPIPQQPPVQTHVVQQVQGGPGAGFPNPDDFYPESARLLQEQGVATLQVCVDEKGRLNAAPSVLQSAGSQRLDEGALKLAKAGSGHYRATTQDGQPVPSCYPLAIRFRLRN